MIRDGTLLTAATFLDREKLTDGPVKELHSWTLMASLGQQNLMYFQAFSLSKKLYCAAQSLRCILRGKRDGWWILRLKWLLG